MASTRRCRSGRRPANTQVMNVANEQFKWESDDKLSLADIDKLVAAANAMQVTQIRPMTIDGVQYYAVTL